MAKKVTVIYNPRIHVSRILTGLRILEDKGLLCVSFVENIGNIFNLPQGPIVEVQVDGIKLAFDMGDRWALCDEQGKEYLERVDYYFARDYSTKTDIVTPETFMDNPKVQPFGLYYYVTYPNNPLDKTPKGVKNRIKKLSKYIIGYNNIYYPSSFESGAIEKNKNMKIIFMTRLWNTNEFDSAKKSNISKKRRDYIDYLCEERNQINQRRIEIMRRLKLEYGSTFIGGMFDDDLSRAICPDLIASNDKTRKKSYMNKLALADIGIGTTGLHRSIGGKIGEYVAASKAIVTEKLEYEVPGQFEEGKNYLSFKTEDECVGALNYLLNNPELVFSMKKANEKYYKEYVNPEIQVMNALQIAGVEFF